MDEKKRSQPQEPAPELVPVPVAVRTGDSVVMDADGKVLSVNGVPVAAAQARPAR